LGRKIYGAWEKSSPDVLKVMQKATEEQSTGKLVLTQL
jgi:hypothetical protein